ncbi:ATP-binding protein [Mesorhizobium sp. M1004]|uniref:hypothetical protein n=1 Tax=Mesorhizobium sp. M1004 TaxID=2957046 RepID=UPI003336AEAF
MFGIGCRKNSDGADGATALEPNPEPVALSVVSSAVGDLLHPKNDGIRVAGFASNADQNAEFIVIDVPRSERRPHRSDQKQYYKRAGSSSYLWSMSTSRMPSEVPELTMKADMRNTRRPALTVIMRSGCGRRTGAGWGRSGLNPVGMPRRDFEKSCSRFLWRPTLRF